MFGGAAQGQSSTHTHVTTTSTISGTITSTEPHSTESHPRLLGRTARTALLAGALFALATGLALTDGPEALVAEAHLRGLRQILLTTGGALLFGAGLLQLATWRISHEPAQGWRGSALGVAGLTTAFLPQIGVAVTLPSAMHSLGWGFALGVLLATSSTIVLAAALSAFLSTAADEEQRLTSAETALRVAARAALSHDEEQQDLRHDARNALFALRLATQTLADLGDRLDAETRQRLRGAVLQEVGHLDELISRTTAARVDALGIAKESIPLHTLPAQRVTHVTEAV